MQQVEVNRSHHGSWQEYFARRIDEIRTDYPHNGTVPKSGQYTLDLINEGKVTQDKCGLDNRLFQRDSDLEFYLALCNRRLQLRNAEQTEEVLSQRKVAHRILMLFASPYADKLRDQAVQEATDFPEGVIVFGKRQSLAHLRLYYMPQLSRDVKTFLDRNEERAPLKRARADLGIFSPDEEKPYDVWATALPERASMGEVSAWDRVISICRGIFSSAFVLRGGLIRPAIVLPNEVAVDLYGWGIIGYSPSDYTYRLSRHEFFHTQERFTLGPLGFLGTVIDEYGACYIGDRGSSRGPYPEVKLLFKMFDDLTLGKFADCVPIALSTQEGGGGIYRAISNNFSFDMTYLVACLFPFGFDPSIKSIENVLDGTTVTNPKQFMQDKMNKFLQKLFITATKNIGFDRIRSYLDTDITKEDACDVMDLVAASRLILPTNLHLLYQKRAFANKSAV